MQKQLYEQEAFVNEQVPIRIWNHVLDQTDIHSPLHWHRSIEIDIVISGRVEYKMDGQSQYLHTGDVLIINSGMLHSNHWIDRNDHFQGVTILISKSFLDMWLGKDVYLKVPEDMRKRKELFDTVIRIGQIEKENGAMKKIELMEVLYHLLLILGSECIEAEYVGSDRKTKTIDNIKKVINYIEQHYKEDISLASVAAQMNYSSAHLSRVFKENIGYNFHDYLQSVRIGNAVRMIMQNKDVRLMECAIENGFTNIKSFIEVFKKIYGCTPSEWRKEKNIKK